MRPDGIDRTGTLTLSGLNTYSGATTIDNGAVLAAGVADAFSANSAVTDNGELDLGTADQTIASLNSTNTAALVGSFSGSGTGPAVLTINNGGSFAGVIEDGSKGVATALTLAGGTLTLTSDNTYTGATTIDGTLVLTGTGSISDSSGVDDEGTFDISGLTNGGTSIKTLSGDGSVTLGAKTLTLTAGNDTFSGVIGGNGGLTVDGTGTETLTGVDTYTGATTIGSNETLALSGSGSIAASGGVADSGIFVISATTAGASIKTLSGDGSVTLGAKTLTLTKGNDIFSGVISGSGALTVDGSGTETLSGANTYTGATTIGSGETLALSGTGSIAGSSDVIDNGTFDISATTSGASIVTLSGDGTVDLGSKTLTLTAGNDTFSGVISGSGALTVDGTGTETLSGTNTYTRRDHDRFQRDAGAVGHRLDCGLQRRHRQRHLRHLGHHRRLDQDAVGRGQCQSRRRDADADGGSRHLLGRDLRRGRTDGRRQRHRDAVGRQHL